MDKAELSLHKKIDYKLSQKVANYFLLTFTNVRVDKNVNTGIKRSFCFCASLERRQLTCPLFEYWQVYRMKDSAALTDRKL